MSQAEKRPLGIFDDRTDVGTVDRPGSALHDSTNQVYLVEGSGSNMWSDHDDFYFVWKKLRGDFIVRSHAEFEGPGIHPHRKMGWTVRSNLEPDSAHVSLAVHGDGLTALQYRPMAGAETREVRSDITAPEVIQLTRSGRTFTMSVARFGDTFKRDEVSRLTAIKDDDAANEGASLQAENTRKAAQLRAVHSLLTSAQVLLEDY